MVRELLRNTFVHRAYHFVKGNLYRHLPARYAFGKAFVEKREFLANSEYWSGQQIYEYQLNEIRKLVRHAFENVPYYNEVFTKEGIGPEHIKEIGDIKKLPYLTKEIIKENRNRLLARNIPQKYITTSTTGGTTGTPMGFYTHKKHSFPVEWAYISDMWRRVGYKHGDRTVVLRGKVVSQIKEDSKYWQTDHRYNWLIMSSYHLTEDTAELYIKKIRQFKPKYIQAYPSVLTILASYMKKKDFKSFPTVKAIFCASETIYDWQKKDLEKVFKTRIYSFYGHTERCCLAGECEFASEYHCYPQYGFTELINGSGEWCRDEGEKGEIVVTGFSNYVFPFIRYRTQDIGVHTNKACLCGRKWKLIKKVDGRLQDFFVDKTGSLTTFTCSDDALWGVKEKISAYQYTQDTPGKVSLNIECKKELSQSEKEKIISTFLRFYPGFEVELNLVEHIHRTRRGKFKYLIQNLPINFEGSFSN